MFKSFIQKIFSAKNEYEMNNGSVLLKRKIVTLLGIKLKFKLGKLTDNGNKIIFIKDGKEYPLKGKVKYFDSIKINGKNNTISINADFINKDGNKVINIIGDDNIVTIGSGELGDIRIKIKGNQNIVDLEYKKIGRLLAGIVGDKNRILAESDCEISDLNLNFLFPANSREFSLGKSTTIGGAKVYAWADNSSIKTGEGCMLSWGVQILSSDAHKIIDKNTGECVNSGDKFIEIGNHVWIGHDVNILKNVKIADNSIVGACSVVTKQFDEPNVAIAGNPAKIVKRDIDWDRETA